MSLSNLFVADEKKIRKRLLSVIGSALPACQMPGTEWRAVSCRCLTLYVIFLFKTARRAVRRYTHPPLPSPLYPPWPTASFIHYPFTLLPMAPTKFLNFVAIVSFAVFYISLTPISANALAVERAHVARNLNYAHAGIAKKKRDNHNPSKRCKPRPTSSSLPPSTTPPPAYTPSSPSPSPQPSSSPAPSPQPESSSTPTYSSSSSSYSPAATPASSSGIGKVGIDWSNNEEGNLCNFKTGSVTQSVFLFYLRQEPF